MPLDGGRLAFGRVPQCERRGWAYWEEYLWTAAVYIFLGVLEASLDFKLLYIWSIIIKLGIDSNVSLAGKSHHAAEITLSIPNHIPKRMTIKIKVKIQSSLLQSRLRPTSKRRINQKL